MRLEQTAHMLVFCRQAHALKAIYLSVDGLGSSVMGALWRKMKHRLLKREDTWRTLLQTLWVWMCAITIREFHPNAFLSCMYSLWIKQYILSEEKPPEGWNKGNIVKICDCQCERLHISILKSFSLEIKHSLITSVFLWGPASWSTLKIRSDASKVLFLLGLMTV